MPPAVEAVRRRIEEWRSTRSKRTRMSEDLWDAAASVANQHGLWLVSRALRVNYAGLKRRVHAKATRSPKTQPPTSFVEVPASTLLGQAAPRSTVVEVCRPDGAKLTVRLEGHGAIDIPALTAAFWQHHA